MAAFKKALEINGNDQGALNGLTQLKQLVRLMRQNEDGQADPNSVAYVDMDTFRGMISGQIDSLAEEPDQLVALADQLMRDGMILDVVISALEKSLEARPNHERTIMMLASAFRAADRHPEALALVQRFTELLPDEPAGFMHLAQAYNTLGEHEKEHAALGRVLDLVIDAGACAAASTTVVDLAVEPAVIVRLGAGDPGPGRRPCRLDRRRRRF